MRAIVTGAVATYAVGGVAWDYGQYALGLERLGFEVYYLEDTGRYTYDAAARTFTDDPSFGVQFLQDTLGLLSPRLAERWHFRAADGSTYGLDRRTFGEIVASADLFLNHSGFTLLRDEYLSCPRKIFLDTDPGWNHFWVLPRSDELGPPEGCRSYRDHDYFFTYAERLGRPDCPLPDLGLSWQPTRPAVVRECWPCAAAGSTWTTVMNWNDYGDRVEHAGETYGSKDVEFARVETLPSQVDSELELAIGGNTAPRERLRQLGWRVVDGPSVSATAESYRRYILDSHGEFSVAKNIYAATRSGWFSFRSCCYLASGRPVVLQDTGFSELVPTGAGLIAYTTLDEAAQAIADVERDYEHHQAAARELARAHFDSDLVLTELLTRIGLG